MAAQDVEITNGETAPEADSGCGGNCTCGQVDGEIELDVRSIPKPIRHGAVRGAFTAIDAGNSLVLLAPHEPRRLMAELTEDAGGRIEFTPLDSEDETYRLRVTRTA